MRINRADIDLWRARELQGTHRVNEAQPSSVPERRFDVRSGKPMTDRRRRVGNVDALDATPPLNSLLEETSGNVAILRHLIEQVLPTLPMSDDVRQCASALFIEDMEHHRRVLEAHSGEDKEMELDGKLE
ncbi:hypothetical protein [Advenella mimigardefordensis]|uniref:Uncharacterized protein n=1 Tax=Advenella mimigardefordensis (strain DSM 17166 / LMG 22922 / DPN7) TaxID=1247726 RepID=W0PAX8_ADVMD|nr:hypothetical protein [Advenella mimigardefordensis]AHG62183.1 hypothetical protein MIM_c00800 [Advenella mimigardefordensis DPN7]